MGWFGMGQHPSGSAVEGNVDSVAALEVGSVLSAWTGGGKEAE